MTTTTHSKKVAALLIGINYVDSSSMTLRGCWNDAMGIARLLQTTPFSFQSKDIRILQDRQHAPLTRAILLAELKAFIQRSWDDDLDVAVVSYSGHGSHQQDQNGDESDGYDEGICPSDCMYTGLITDDLLHSMFAGFNPKTHVYAVFDSCHSGTVLDLPFQFPPPRHSSNSSIESEVGPTILMISGCKDEQTSADAYDRRAHAFGGALTTALLKELHAHPEIDVVTLCEAINASLKEEGYDQRPIVSCSRPITEDLKFFC
jgi:hypothetical protein